MPTPKMATAAATARRILGFMRSPYPVGAPNRRPVFDGTLEAVFWGCAIGRKIPSRGGDGRVTAPGARGGLEERRHLGRPLPSFAPATPRGQGVRIRRAGRSIRQDAWT